jgi:hypothetical protein
VRSSSTRSGTTRRPAEAWRSRAGRHALAAALLLALSSVARSGEGAPPGPPRSVEGLLAGIERAEERLGRLYAKSQEDPRVLRIERYRAMKEAPRPGAKRETTARDLVKMLSDADAPRAVRERARDALSDPHCKMLDPDLASGAGASPRVVLSRDLLVPLLSSKDELSRRLSAEVLAGYFFPTDPAIRRYDPTQPSTWKPAQTAWTKYFRGR